MDEESLSVQIKMVNNPFEVKKSKDYFKKKEFFLPSNVAGGMQNQINFLEHAFDDENLS
jgi:BTB And C-terminal Kelch